MIPLITRAQYLEAPGGVSTAILERIPAATLDRYCQTATSLAGGHVKTRFDFQWIGGGRQGDPAPELHAIDFENTGPTLDFALYNLPVRKITAFEIVDAVRGGAALGTDLDPGDVFEDPQSGYGQATLARLITRALPLTLFGYVEPQLYISYTSGYDPGYVLDENGEPTSTPTAPDGLVNLTPDWLMDVLRIIVDDLIGEWVNEQRGMAGLDRLVAGPFSYARPARRNTKEETAIPRRAAMILEANAGDYVEIGAVQG